MRKLTPKVASAAHEHEVAAVLAVAFQTCFVFQEHQTVAVELSWVVRAESDISSF